MVLVVCIAIFVSSLGNVSASISMIASDGVCAELSGYIDGGTFDFMLVKYGKYKAQGVTIYTSVPTARTVSVCGKYYNSNGKLITKATGTGSADSISVSVTISLSSSTGGFKECSSTHSLTTKLGNKEQKTFKGNWQ